MKRAITFLLSFFLLTSISYADEVTPNLGLTKPSLGSTQWGQKMNTNLDLLDSLIGVTITLQSGSGLVVDPTTGLSLLRTCSDQQIPKWTAATSSWGCASAGAGTVAEIQGTANEVEITSGGTGPVSVIGLPATVDLSGKNLIIPGKATASLPTAAGSIARDTTTGILYMGDGTNAKCNEEKSQNILIDKCYGVVNDGVTDDTVALQAMLTALEPLGGTIIKTGNSAISTQLTWEGSGLAQLYIVGSGVSAGLTWNGAVGGTMLSSGTASGDKGVINPSGLTFTSTSGHRAGVAIFLQSTGSNVIFKNRFLDVTDAIYLKGVLLAAIDMNRFDNVAQDCISLNGGADRENNGNWVTRNEFSACGRYAFNGTSDVTNNGNVIMNNSFEPQLAGSIATIYAGISRGVIAYNRFEDGCLADADYRAIVVPGIAFLTIMGNDFGECGSQVDYWIDIKHSPADAASSDVRLIGNKFANAGSLGNIHMMQTDGTNFFSFGDAHNTNNAVVGDTANLWCVVAWASNLIECNNLKFQLSTGNGNYTNAPILEINQKRISVRNTGGSPTTGTWRRGDFVYSVYSSTPVPTVLSDEPLGWFAVTAGTMGTLVGETGGITTGTTALVMDAPSALIVGDMITIAGVSGIKTIVTKTDTTNFVIDSNADATVASAAVAYSNATWEPWYPLFRATPASEGAAGAAGMTAVDANYYYWYTGSTWKRAPNVWGLTASKCVATDASKNLVSSAADCNTIAANAVTATEIDETDDYNFTGLLTTPIAIASLPAFGTAGRLRWVNDATGSSCTVDGGAALVLCYDNGTAWAPIAASADAVTAGSTLTSTAFVTGGGSKTVQTPSATSTLDASGNAVFAGSVTADSFSLGGASTSCDGTAGCYEMGQGTAPSGAPTANTIRHYAPTGVTAYSIIHPTTAATGYRYLSNSSGTMTETIVNTWTKSIWFGAGSLSTDGTQCAAPAEVTPVTSGPKVWSIICTDNDAATIYGSVQMPTAWDGGTVTFTHVYQQTAADTGVLNGDIACQARSNGEAPADWATGLSEIAIDDAAVVGSGSNDMTTSAAVTCAGTGLAGGDMLYFRYQLDATGTTTAVATLHHLGFMMKYGVTGLTD